MLGESPSGTSFSAPQRTQAWWSYGIPSTIVALMRQWCGGHVEPIDVVAGIARPPGVGRSIFAPN
jgi:hypothetical protein